MTIDLFSNDCKKAEWSQTITTSVSSYKIDEPTMEDVNHISLQAELVKFNLNQSNSDVFNFSKAGLVLTDSDSGQDDAKIDNYGPKTTTFKPLTMSLTGKGYYETKTLGSLPNNSPFFTPLYNMMTKTKTKFPIPSNEFKISHGY